MVMSTKFERLRAQGWSGCMHDSDCACSARTRAADDRLMLAWKRREGGYLREDGEWFLYRGAPMSSGGTNAWLLHRRIAEGRVGRDSSTCYDKRNGQVLWRLSDDGYVDTAPADFTGDLYAHDHDAGALAEAKHVVASIEAEEPAPVVIYEGSRG